MPPLLHEMKRFASGASTSRSALSSACSCLLQSYGLRRGMGTGAQACSSLASISGRSNSSCSMVSMAALHGQHVRVCSTGTSNMRTAAPSTSRSASTSARRVHARASDAPSSSSSPSPLSPAAQAAALASAGVQLPQFCPGCGIKLQLQDAKAPGYFVIPEKLLIATGVGAGPRGRARAVEAVGAVTDAGAGEEEDEEYAAARSAKAGRDGADGAEANEEDDGLPDVVCQRCYSLKHAGKIKVESAEAALPDFDLGKKVGRKIFLQKDRRAVVLVVVDAWDFDGSLPREAVMSLYPPGYSVEAAWAQVDVQKEERAAMASGRRPATRTTAAGSASVSIGAPAARADLGVGYAGQEEEQEGEEEAGSSGNTPYAKFRLMVALNKTDLLPKEAAMSLRLPQWVKTRLRQAGLPPADKVFCVSAARGTGVQPLVEGVREALGFRGDLWVVGAQNAGKSSLIAAMKRLGGTAGKGEPTVAPMPGTTLGLINVPGLPLGPKQRAFDTPGVAHPHQLTTLLAPAEVRQVLPNKAMLPRTYRLSAGSTILLGGLARLDVLDHPGATIYLTIFVSSYINLHMGKTEGAGERVLKHVGGQLVPPASPERFAELPAWTARTVSVEGGAWDRSSTDIHIAGLGWVAVGVKGQAQFKVWVAPSVAITTRPSLVWDYAREFERPGFSTVLPKAASVAAGKAEASVGSKAEGRGGKGGKGARGGAGRGARGGR